MGKQKVKANANQAKIMPKGLSGTYLMTCILGF